MENRLINFSVCDFVSCASSTISIILPKVVSSPTAVVSTVNVPFSRIVPAYTSLPAFLLTNLDSPLTLASLR